ncbi:hypothetical protein H1Q63_21360 [Desmonostoc muscorum CCALA 125]|nr:hypothetical protein [Desmonostoc muscorum CCALA 125]
MGTGDWGLGIGKIFSNLPTLPHPPHLPPLPTPHSPFSFFSRAILY